MHMESLSDQNRGDCTHAFRISFRSDAIVMQESGQTGFGCRINPIAPIFDSSATGPNRQMSDGLEYLVCEVGAILAAVYSKPQELQQASPSRGWFWSAM